MRSRRRGPRARCVVALGLAAGLVASQASGQPQPGGRPRRLAPPVGFSRPAPAAAGAAAEGPGADLRAHFGLDLAMRLLRSPDAGERIRGLERVAATHTPDAMALLVRASQAPPPGGFDPRAPPGEGAARLDSRAMLVIVRALAGWSDRPAARTALAELLDAPARVPAVATDEGDPAAEEAESAARVQLARQEAAIALAQSREASAIDALVVAARKGGVGQAAALEALALDPPEGTVLGGVALTTPSMIALAANVGDLRALGAVLGQVKTSDAATRAAAIAALGDAGDARVLDVAREAVKDKEPRVRVAAAEALAKLGAPDAPQAVEALVGEDATAREGLRVALGVSSEGVTKAAAARAAASSDPELRALAVQVLGRQDAAAAVTALAQLAADIRLQGDAVAALARSPSPAALPAVEALADAPATRRLAARAYLVRRIARGQRSGRLDARLAELAASRDGADRAVGVQALVALGERSYAAALADPDARVRRAAALGSLARRGDRAWADGLLARLSTETDETTRQVLALGLAGGDPDGAVPTRTLVERAHAGGPDAPLAAFALARRADAEIAPEVDALLAARDPLLRAHAALGLGESEAPDAAGRLARAYTWEGRTEVRRALARALALQVAHTGAERAAPSARAALQAAARLEPDRRTRAVARSALRGDATPDPGPAPAPAREVAWIRLLPAEGATLPRDLGAAVVDDRGLALPVAFDDDGYVLVPGLSPGEALVRLAPRVPAYQPAPSR